MKLPQSLDDLGMFFRSIDFFPRIIPEMNKEHLHAAVFSGLGGIPRFPDQLPVSLAHRPVRLRAITNLPMKDMMRMGTLRFPTMEHGNEAAPVEGHLGEIHSRQCRERRHPIAGMAQLIPHLSLG